MKTIKVSEDLHNRLMIVKILGGHKSINDAIEAIIKEVKQ